MLLTMVLGGLWHGAGWTFVLWGTLHGVFLAVHKWMLKGRKVHMGPPSTQWGRYFLSMMATFHLVCLAWIFFRAENIGVAWGFLWGIFANHGALMPGYVINIVVYGVVVILLDGSAWLRQSELAFSDRMPVTLRAVAYGTMASMCLWLGSPSPVPFIYFQF